MKNKIIEKLIDFKLFKNISLEDLENFITKIKVNTILKDEIIIEEGHKGNSLFFLIDGQVSISRKMTLSNLDQNNDYQEKEIFNTNSSSKPIFGEIGLFGKNNSRTATIKAVSNCTIGVIDKEIFFNLCEENKTLGYQLLRNISIILSERIMDTNTNVIKLTTALCLILD